MGCDVHFFVEKRVEGKWVSADKWTIDQDDEPPTPRVQWSDSFYSDRNYNLFAILADVRNGRGFAGVKTGEGFNPISPARGLPDDVSADVGMEAMRWAGDGHSHTFMTVQELLDYDWTQTTNLEGDMCAMEFERWERYDRSKGNGPDSYAGAITGRDLVRIDEDKLREMLAKKKAELEKNNVRGPAWKEAMDAEFGKCITRSSWEIPYYKCASNFLAECLPRLLRLGKPADVRIVCWFDN